MPFLKRPSPRRRVFLSLIADIEGGLRAAFVRWARENDESQSGLAKILGVNRSVVNRRLTGHVNLTVETIADMVWALGYCVRIQIFHPTDAVALRNLALVSRDNVPAQVPTAAPVSQPTTLMPLGIPPLTPATS